MGVAMSSVIPTIEIDYPAEDGQPMAETPIHVEAIILLHQALQDFFRDQPDVLVASDIFWYYQEGNPSARVAPDVMVVPEAGQTDRRSFLAWREKRSTPAVVFEMASLSTWREDRREKFRLYETLGAEEYFLFDPEARFLNPPLLGYRLRETAYVPILEENDGSLASSLGFRLRAEGEMLRLLEGRTGLPIPTRLERAEQEHERAEQERQRAEQERQRAEALQAEVERLRALLNQPGQASGNEA
jgi:Uma2 family endonuclease